MAQKMNLRLDFIRIFAIHLLFVIRLQNRYSGVNAKTMCFDSAPMVSPKTLTSIDYPAMVTVAECQCTVIPAQPIEELDIHVQLRRSDRTTDCSRTQVTVVHRNLSTVICPTVDGHQMSGGAQNKGSLMTISLSLTRDDRPVITLWNTHLDFINAQVILTSDHLVSYNVVCTNLEGSFYWPYEDQGLGFDDGIDSGIKVAVIVLFFILVILLSASIRLIARVRLRRAQWESKKQQARLKRISRLEQAMAFHNLGFSSSTLNHSSSNTLNLHSSEKPRHSGDLPLFPTADSTSRSTLKYDGFKSRNITGHGCIWPLADNEPCQPIVENPTHPYVQYNECYDLVSNRSSKPVKVYYANDAYAAGSREMPLPKCSKASPASSQEAQTATISHLASRKNMQKADALLLTRIGSEEEPHDQIISPSYACLASVHQRQPGKSWQKNSRIAPRNRPVENTGQHHKTFDKDERLSISTNVTHRSSEAKGIMTTAVYDDAVMAGRNLCMTSKDRMPRESAI